MPVAKWNRTQEEGIITYIEVDSKCTSTVDVFEIGSGASKRRSGAYQMQVCLITLLKAIIAHPPKQEEVMTVLETVVLLYAEVSSSEIAMFDGLVFHVGSEIVWIRTSTHRVSGISKLLQWSPSCIFEFAHLRTPREFSHLISLHIRVSRTFRARVYARISHPK